MTECTGGYGGSRVHLEAQTNAKNSFGETQRRYGRSCYIV